MKKLILILNAFILCFTLLANPKPIQQKKSETQLQYEVTVTLKLVQVYVTDKDGNSVTDLTKDDFILYDNGKLQTVTDFERHIFRPEKELKEAQPDLTQKTPPLLNRKFFFLLDYSRNDVFGVNKSKNAALHFLDTKLQPTDEVGVLSYAALKGLILRAYLEIFLKANEMKLNPQNVKVDKEKKNIFLDTEGDIDPDKFSFLSSIAHKYGWTLIFGKWGE